MTRKISPEMRAYVKRLAGKGLKQVEIAAKLGISAMSVSRIVENPKRGRPRKRNIERPIINVAHRSRIERDWERQAREIPEDTRGFTERFFGDPLPGRSAWDKRQKTTTEAMA